jgi:MFS family permease
MLFFAILLVPLMLAWTSWLRDDHQQRLRKALSLAGLLLVSLTAILALVAIAQEVSDKGRSFHVLQMERWVYLIAISSIPLLLFGRRMNRWMGLSSAVLIPITTSFVSALY